jgi:hypothetical protein
MDVTKAPPTTDLASFGVGTAVSSAAASQSSAAAGVSTASNASTAVTAAADRVDIQPLDVAAALQILIAEVRAELPLPGANSPAGMNTPPALQAAELVPAELVKADLVAAELPGAVQTPSPPTAEVAAGPAPPTQSAGLVLLESQAMPFNSSTASELLARLSNPEQSVPLAPLIPVTEAPMQAPLPEAPDLAAILLSTAAPVGAEAPGPGYLPQVGDSSAGAGAAAAPSAVLPQTSPVIAFPGAGAGAGSGSNTVVDLAPLPAGGPLPRVELPVIPPDLNLGPLEPSFMPPGARLSSPAQASPVLMRLFLQAVPDDAGNPARWAATVTQLEVTLQSALDRAVAAVEQWRNVPQVVVDAARETRSLVMSQLSDDPPGPLWLRPEWMWLSPRMERFRRRRRLARRGLTDPDLWSLREDDTRQEKRGRRHDEP